MGNLSPGSPVRTSGTSSNKWSVDEASDALWQCLEVWKLPHLLGKGVATLAADTSPLHLLHPVIEFRTERQSDQGLEAFLSQAGLQYCFKH